MAYVVAEPCVDCKYTDCVTVCPIDCFHEGDAMLYIDPQECIDCGACVPECPVEAIFFEGDLPDAWKPYAALNAEMAAKTLRITQKRAHWRVRNAVCLEANPAGVLRERRHASSSRRLS